MAAEIWAELPEAIAAFSAVRALCAAATFAMRVAFAAIAAFRSVVIAARCDVESCVHVARRLVAAAILASMSPRACPAAVSAALS